MQLWNNHFPCWHIAKLVNRTDKTAVCNCNRRSIAVKISLTQDRLVSWTDLIRFWIVNLKDGINPFGINCMYRMFLQPLPEYLGSRNTGRV